MSGALAEALVAAQRRAVTVLEKAYVAGAFADDALREQLDALGCSDAVDQGYLVHALDVLRAYGGPLPTEPRPSAEPTEPLKATDAQVKLAQSLFQRADLVPLAEADLRNLPRERVSQLIESLKAGTYDASTWDVPF